MSTLFKRCSIDRHVKQHFGRGCLAIEGQRIQMPKEGDTISFKNHTRKSEAPYVMYADFECLTMKYSSKISKPLDQNISYTEKYQHHKPCGYKINIVNRTTDESESYVYRGSDCMEHFVKPCIKIKYQIMDKLKVNVPIIMTNEDGYNFMNATHCGICGHELGNDKVRDHCHMTGKYRCCAHSNCNLHLNNTFKFLFYFIILKVTIHIVLYAMLTNLGLKRIDVIAQNSETLVMFGFGNSQQG